LKELIIYLVFLVFLGAFFYFVRGDMAGMLVAFMVCPMLGGYFIYAYLKEKKADKKAGVMKGKILDGSYFESPEWHENYVKYINEHPFEKPKYPDMKKDLLSRFHRREYMVGMIFMLFLMVCAGCAAYMGHYVIGAAGFVIFGLIFGYELYFFMGFPVRKWLRGDMDKRALEASYKNSRMLTCKKNGLAFGTTHLHGFTEKKIYAIDYRLIEGISGKTVRLKTYEDGIFSKDEYQFFALIHVKLPYSGKTEEVEIELNEFQVRMAIDRLALFKTGETLQNETTVTEKKENESVI